MHKVILVAWDKKGRGRGPQYELFVERVAPQMLAAGAERLSMCVSDHASNVRSPNPFPLFGQKPTGIVNAFVDDLSTTEALVAILSEHGMRVGAYHVEESIYRDYGSNEHGPPRDWPDGARSRGVMAVTLMERPTRLDRDEWISRWHGRMSPVSEAIQPRTRYVRNLVVTALTPEAPPFEGIVEEAWPSPKHVTNPFLFYGATNPWQLVVNLCAILRAVLSFLTLWRIQTVMTSEYFIRS